MIQKAFYKNTSPIHNKTQKTRNRGKLLQFGKVIYKKPTANIEVKNSEIGNKARMLAFTTAVQHNTSCSECNKEKKEYRPGMNKTDLIYKWHDVCRKSILKLLALISEFNKVAVYQINMKI